MREDDNADCRAREGVKSTKFGEGATKSIKERKEKSSGSYPAGEHDTWVQAQGKKPKKKKDSH